MLLLLLMVAVFAYAGNDYNCYKWYNYYCVLYLWQGYYLFADIDPTVSAWLAAIWLLIYNTIPCSISIPIWSHI